MHLFMISSAVLGVRVREANVISKASSSVSERGCGMCAQCEVCECIRRVALSLIMCDLNLCCAECESVVNV